MTFPDAFAAASGQAGVRVVNASPALGTSDVFVTEPGVVLSGSPTFEDVAFDAEGTPAFTIPANQVRTFVVADVAGGGMPTSEDNVIMLQACS